MADGSTKKQRKKRWGWILTGIGAVVLAAATAFAGGLGSRLANSVGSDDPQLISYSIELLSTRCRGGEYVPRSSFAAVMNANGQSRWEILEQQPGAAQAHINPVQVAIQGETGRPVTLTRVDFHVSRQPRSPGGLFVEPCGDAFTGRSLEVDLDANPPRIVDSNSTEEGALGARSTDGLRPYRPIRFPWTVSVNDPLLLEILGTTSSCDCTWSAEIPWVSGSSQGTIVIDNNGDGYRVVGTDDLPVYEPSTNGWSRSKYWPR
ncbi:MAG TPA: hypothetical protein VFS54_08555 [Solirubrobacterales bacterium]|nr:hypothetical protein [Solirubrobacterales bacterium]